MMGGFDHESGDLSTRAPSSPRPSSPSPPPALPGRRGRSPLDFRRRGLVPAPTKSIHNGVLSRYQRDGGRRSASSPLSGSNGPMRSASSARTSLARRSDGRFAMKTTLLLRFLQG